MRLLICGLFLFLPVTAHAQAPRVAPGVAGLAGTGAAQPHFPSLPRQPELPQFPQLPIGYFQGLGPPSGSVFGDVGTPFSAGTRAMSDFIRSWGIYQNLVVAARQVDLYNRGVAIEGYFAARNLNRQMRAAERGPRGTYETHVRLAQTDAPQRLSPGELDIVSGRIAWPVLLRSHSYTGYRAELEHLFAFRAVNGGLAAEQFLRIDELTRMLMEELRARVALLPPQEYVRAKRFVQSLNFEASFPPV